MADEDNTLQAGTLTAGELTLGKITKSAIEADHIAIMLWNTKTGEEAKYGVKHLYSDKYREKWPQDQYPQKYEEDEPID